MKAFSFLRDEIFFNVFIRLNQAAEIRVCLTSWSAQGKKKLYSTVKKLNWSVLEDESIYLKFFKMSYFLITSKIEFFLFYISERNIMSCVDGR